jgi:hypothetical protein
LRAKENGQQYEHAVIVTNDRKPDWSRGNTAHPVLTAEVQALVGVSFDLWTLDRLSDAISEEVVLPAPEVGA